MINRILHYKLLLIISVCSCLLSNDEINSEIITVKLNISPNKVDGREWIPYRGGNKISNKEFWQLLGNEQHVDYWSVKEREMKDLFYKRPIKFFIYTPLTIFGLMFHTKSKEPKSYADGFGTYEYPDTEYTWYGYIGLPFGFMSLKELYKWSIILISLPIKDPVSYYEVKPLVEEYNEKNE